MRTILPHSHCPPSIWFWYRASLVLLLFPGLFFATGCGKGGQKNSVSGKIHLKGEPVAGTIAFIGADGKEVNGPITPDGTYIVFDPPLGEDKITVKGMPGMTDIRPQKTPAMPGNPTPAASMGVSPPAKYAVPTNGLTFKVTGGQQTYDIELKP